LRACVPGMLRIEDFASDFGPSSVSVCKAVMQDFHQGNRDFIDLTAVGGQYSS
jgi:hypothetical protein